MTATETRQIALSLETSCGQMCESVSVPLFEQLSSGRYDLCSAVRIPGTIDEWRSEHRTARKRAKRATVRGYVSMPLAREHHADEIHAINTSAQRRQGRPMSAGYLERHDFPALPDYPCARHAIRPTGVWDGDGTLVAYLVMHRAGDLALVSQILGHAAHLGNEIMYLLFEHALRREIHAGSGAVVYNRHDSGTDGLRFFKERLGFSEMEVAWLR